MAKNQISVLNDAKVSLDELNAKLIGINDSILKISASAREAGKGGIFNAKIPNDVSASLEKNKAIQKELADLSNKRAETERLAQLKIQQAREKAFDKYERQLQKEKNAREAQVNKESALSQRLIAQRKKEETQIQKANELSAKLGREYTILVSKMNIVGKTVQDLTAKKLQGNKLSLAEQAQLKKSTAEFQRYQTAVLGADKSIGVFNRNVGNYPKGMMAAANAARSFAGALGFTSGLILAVNVMKEAYQTIKEFNSGLLNVSKTTGIVGKDLDELGEDIIKLSNKLGTVGVKSILEYATVAGQLGVKGSANILAFAESLSKLETASDISGEQGGASVARLLTLTDGGVQNVKSFSDELVKLGNNFAATETEILDNSTAIAQNTGIYKLGRQQVLAYGVATKAVGIEAEITGSTIGKTLGTLEKAIRTNKGLEDISRLTGISQKELGKAFKENSGEVLNKLIKGLNGVDKAGGSVNAELEKLGVTAVRDQRVIVTLATAGYDTLAASMRDVVDAAGSLDEEFKTASGKLENQVNRIGIAWDNFVLGIEDGKGTLGSVIKGFADGFVRELDRTNLRLNENISTVDKWKVRISGAVNNMSFGLIEPFKESIDIMIAHTIGLSDNTNKIQQQTEAYIEQYGSIGPLTNEQIKLNNATKDYFSLLLENNDGIDNDGKQSNSIASLRKEIKDLNDEIETLDKTDKEGIKTRQDKVKSLQSELDAILGVNKATKSATEAVKGSLAAMEKEVSILKEKQSKLAVGSKAYVNYEKGIRVAEQGIKDFKDEVALLLIELDGVNAGLSSIGNTESSIGKLSELINAKDFGKLKGFDYDGSLKELDDFSKEFVSKETARLERIGQLTSEFQERQKQLNEDFAYGAIDLTNTLFDAKIQRYEDDIKKNNDYYSALISNEELSDEQKLELENERIRKEKEIEKKKRDEMKKAAAFNKLVAIAEIGIKTAQQIAAINLAAAEMDAITPFAFGATGLAFRAIQIPMAIANGALQAGIVLATPLPQYEKGKGAYDNYEGPAIWGEKKREVKISKDGNIEISPRKIGNHLTHVKKDDVIHPDADKFLSSFTDEQLYNDIHKYSILASLSSQNDSLRLKQSIDSQTDRLIKGMKQNKPKVVIYNNNTNTLSDDISFMLRKQNTL